MIEKVEVRRALFCPEAVAVVGASPHPQKLGNFVLRSIKASGIKKIYAVRRGTESEILGIKAYPSIKAIPEENIDLFLLCVPQHAVLKSLEDALQKGCKGTVIYAGGFKEADEAGLKLQESIKKLADEAGIGIIGPNTLGYFSTSPHINATFMPVLSTMFPEKGNVSIISQSGGVASQIVIKMFESSLPIGTLICLGNRANIDFHNALAFLTSDEQTSIVGIFVEGIDDVRAFYNSAKECAQKKPVVVFSAGISEAGKKAAKSHTGSMATSPDIYKGMFKQAGLLQVHSVEEMVDLLKALHFGCTIDGENIALITHTAGPAIIATDVLSNRGLKLRDFSSDTRRSLEESKVIPEFMPIQNPVDMAASGYLERSRYLDVIDILQKDPDINAILPICISPLGDPNIEVFPFEELELREKTWKKPVVFAWLTTGDNKEEFDKWNKAGVPAYSCPARAARVIANLSMLSKLRKKPKELTQPIDLSEEIEKTLKKFIKEGRTYLGEIESKKILKLLGIKTVDTLFVASPAEAIEAASRIGYPVVMKIVDSNIVHKSSRGGVRLNIKSPEEVIKTFQHFEAIGTPDGFKGTTIQPQVPEGAEIIVGGMDDAHAGPVIMVGTGGTQAETIRDISFRIAPIDETTAVDMIQDLKISTIANFNLTVLSDILRKISHLIYLHPIKEIDLNPIIFYGSDYSVVDARIILLKSE